ncbi:MAG: hypothetical protein HUJ31_05410 [Pseudomonadales bacterium]|nr:hypothetical protein [Pseudomonadales bacterium]
MNYRRKHLLALLPVLILAGCMSTPPERPDNVCEIFYEKDDWYKDARRAERRWGTPIPVLMAFAHQESGFRSRARPPRKKILWIFPGPRPASAFGYSQATDEAWDEYKKSTGRWGADRHDFDDAMDFIGWYNHQSHRRNGIAKSDTYSLYLAYHEGQGGFARRTFSNKQWLKDVAHKVSRRANMYGEQLKTCEKDLRRGWFSRIFLFWL